MAVQGRHAWTFVAGALLGGAIAVWAYMAWFTAPKALITPATASLPAPVAMAPVAPQPEPSVQTVAAAPAGSCAFDPLVARSNERDGQFALDAALAIHRSGDPAPFLAVADEAAREGRARDAEVALMVACRIAGQSGSASTPAADAQSRLANHYANLAARQPTGPGRTELLERAQALLGSSVEVYSAALGTQSSKTRMAEQRLAALREPTPRVVSLPESPRPEETASMGSARMSLAEKPVRRDEPVGELDQDLQRLYSQARAVSRDPAGLERRHQQALAQRAACRGDEDCLRAWASARKRQLFSEFATR